MTQKRIFAILWPDAPPGPLDADARQARYIRVHRRGPLRLVLIITMTIATFGVALLGAIGLASSPSIPGLLIVLPVVVLLVAVTVRAWQVGTYVNDHGVRIIHPTRTFQCTWTEIPSIESPGDVVTLGLDPPVPTHIRARGLDHLGDRESYDIARDRIINWWQGR